MADHEPKDRNVFFLPLVNELKVLGQKGLDMGNEENVKVKLKMVTADLPAKKKVSFSIIIDQER